MAARFVGNVSNQSLAPCRGLGLALFIRRHRGVAGTDDGGTSEIIQAAADAPPADNPMQTVGYFSIDSDGGLLRHRAPPIRYLPWAPPPVRPAVTSAAGPTRQDTPRFVL